MKDESNNGKNILLICFALYVLTEIFSIVGAVMSSKPGEVAKIIIRTFIFILLYSNFMKGNSVCKVILLILNISCIVLIVVYFPKILDIYNNSDIANQKVIFRKMIGFVPLVLYIILFTFSVLFNTRVKEYLIEARLKYIG